MTRAVYIAQVDALCKNGDAEEAPLEKAAHRVEYEEHLGLEQEAAKLVPLWEKRATLDRAFDARVRAVRQPPGDGAILEKIAAGHEDQATLAERVANLLRQNPEVAGYEALLKEGQQEDAHLFTLEQGYGFKICGASSKSSSSTKASSKTSESPATLRLGQPIIVGTIRITPTSLVKLNTYGEVVVWRAAITVKNIGSQPAQVFCGGDATLTDTLGRTYEGKGVIGEGSEDCGEKLQPGLSGSSYRVDFKTPTNATPAMLSLWGDSEYSEQARTWTVH